MRDRILELLQSQAYRPCNETDLAKRLGLHKKQRSALTHEVRMLLSEGQLQRVEGDRLRWSAPQADLRGRITFKSQGIAFVIPEDERDRSDNGDVFVEADDTGVALQGDLVAVRLLAGGQRNQRSRRGSKGNNRKGRVIAVVERARDSLVGTLRKAGGRFFLQPDDPRNPELRIVEDKDAAAAAPGDKIVARMSPWTDRSQPLCGVIERRLGKQFEPSAELLGVYEKFHLERNFPIEVEREANAIPPKVRPEEIAGRMDFRQIPTITIDPDDAKDFDDALSIETLEQGRIRVGVHIADVSSYVRPGTALDREARQRGNSTYLVGTVVPMLPERLSNGLCSLVEAEDRLTMAVLLTFDRTGKLQKTEYARTVIRSRKRLSYRQAYALLFKNDFDEIRAMPALPVHQTGSTGRPLSDLSDLELVDIQSWLRKLWAIAKKLRQTRMDQGCLDLDMPETKIFVDAKGYADRLVKVVNDESHQLIEEFMLAANEALARLTRTSRLPSIYRVHDEPDSRRLYEFRDFATVLGMTCGDLSNREEMNRFLKASESHPQAYLIKSQLLRSLRKACYRSSPDGHYGLNKKDYTHFTSPIRRYSDLVVHRVLLRHLSAVKGSMAGSMAADMQKLAEHLSETESNSQEAERESFKIKLLEFFERELDRKPKTRFKAIITEVRLGGLFIELVDSMTFGFMSYNAFTDDEYSPSPDGSALVGRRKHKRIKLGSQLDVVVDKVDRFRRLIDFAPA
jgi:ribonuclease R